MPLLSPPVHVVKLFKKPFINLQMRWISCSFLSTLYDNSIIVYLYVCIFAYLHGCVCRWWCAVVIEKKSEKQFRNISKSIKMVQQCYQHWQSIFDHIPPFLPEHVIKPLKMLCTNLQMRWCLCVFIIPTQPQKRTYSVTPTLLAVSFPSILTKKSCVAALLMPIISKAETFIFRAIAGNSCSIPSKARPLQVD